MISTLLSRVLQFPLMGKLRHSPFASLIQGWWVRGKTYSVRFGPLKGSKLIFSEGLSIQEVLGLTDFRQMKQLGRFLKKYFADSNEIVVVDAGANVGIYSLWFAKLFTSRLSNIYSFEPSSKTRSALIQNLHANSLSNVEVSHYALADREGELEFVDSGDPHTSHLKLESGNEQKINPSSYVKTTTLDQFFSAKSNLPNFLKIDIEGGAALALQAADRCLANRPLLFIESHNHEEDKAIQNIIFKHHYVAYRMNNEKWVSKPKEIHPNLDGVWGRLLLIPVERMETAMATLPQTK